VFPHLIDPATHAWLYTALLLCTAVVLQLLSILQFERQATRVSRRR
jgi:hypothetical protein